jgi:hypothetical protein
MAQIIGVASLGAMLTLTTMLVQNSQRHVAVSAVTPASLSIGEIGAKQNAKSPPQQHIEDPTMIFVGP